MVPGVFVFVKPEPATPTGLKEEPVNIGVKLTDDVYHCIVPEFEHVEVAVNAPLPP